MAPILHPQRSSCTAGAPGLRGCRVTVRHTSPVAGHRPGCRRAARNSRGIALIQVLLISGIIGLLMLQLSLTASEQVARARRIADRVEAGFSAETQESALLFALLTEPWTGPRATQDAYAAVWRFDGRPFRVGEVELAVQDESGRLRVPLYGALEFEQLLLALGVDADRARRLGDQLLVLQGTRRGLTPPGAATSVADGRRLSLFPVQAVDELRHLPDMDASLYQRLEPLITVFPSSNFNALSAPREVLAAILPASQRDAVLDLRERGELDAMSFWKLTGTEPDDFHVPLPGPGVTITVTVRHGGATVRRSLTADLRPYQDHAVAVFDRREPGAE